MSDINDSNEKPSAPRAGGNTLSLKRPSIEQSKVKQNFAHGRTKTVVVETKRKRFGDDKPAVVEDKSKFQAKPHVAATPVAKPVPTAPARPGVVLRTLSTMGPFGDFISLVHMSIMISL